MQMSLMVLDIGLRVQVGRAYPGHPEDSLQGLHHPDRGPQAQEHPGLGQDHGLAGR